MGSTTLKRRARGRLNGSRRDGAQRRIPRTIVFRLRQRVTKLEPQPGADASLEDELESGVVRIVAAVENVQATGELWERLQQERKVVYIEQAASDLCICANATSDVVRSTCSLRNSQSGCRNATLRDVCSIQRAEPCGAAVVVRVAAHNKVNERAVVRRTRSDLVEGFEEARLTHVRNGCEYVYLVDVVRALQVNGVFADVIDFQDVLLPKLSLEAENPFVHLRSSQRRINRAD